MDENKTVPAIVREYMGALGRKGGSSRSPAKRRAAQLNARRATRVRMEKMKKLAAV